MATDTNDLEQDLVTLNLTYKGTPHTYSFSSNATISDLAEEVVSDLSIPATNQKFMIPKLGTLKTPFKDPDLPIFSFADKKITLLGSTTKEANAIGAAAHEASRNVQVAATRRVQKVKAYKTHDWKREQEENLYTFTTLRPLPYLPNPQKSLEFLQRLKDDAGIKASMRTHKFTVPLLTEMNPIEHTQSNHEGTSRTLGLNRNRGEAIELRLRTDAYDGYRDYKTIRNTLCHELAHNVHGTHDRQFWDLCKQIEKEVEGSDWKSSGRRLGNEEYYGGEVDDHGGWDGGEFMLGGGGVSSGAERESESLSRSEIMAKAAEARKTKEQESSQGDGSSDA
ncbi:zinc metallo protein-like proteinase [Calycina marina]|uniref:Zinc metallo protein-like proteinase n=1 Tax=Calycina marina TaxID=1763456 RepID=A0A9P7YVP9_9HELO|nr:zinc metallo protein-like proteinase [Calycina marina]